jgi:hypothetical protein
MEIYKANERSSEASKVLTQEKRLTEHQPTKKQKNKRTSGSFSGEETILQLGKTKCLLEA